MTSPQNLDAELAVLGAMLSDSDAVESARSVLTAKDFFRTGHGMIFDAACAVARLGPPDLISVAAELANRQQTQLVGGLAYLAVVFEYAVSAKNLRAHCRIVRQKSQQRQIHTMTRALLGEIESGAMPEDLQKRLRTMADLDAATDRREARHISEIIAEGLIVGPEQHVPLGLTCLAPLHVRPGNLCVIGARPGCGKTALLGTIAVHAARAGWNVLLFSLEMPAQLIGQRLLATEAGIPLNDVMAGKGDPSLLARLPIWIEDDPAFCTIEAIPQYAKAFAHTYADRPTVVMVDYMQIVRTRQKIDRRHEYVGYVCRELKHASLAVKVPIIAAAQLNRAVEQRGKDARPQLSDIRESGEIEAHADQVILMHREPDRTLLRVAKYRMGPVFTGEAYFTESRTCFEDRDWQ